MKLVETADILDSPLSGHVAYKDAPADLLRTITRDAFIRQVGEVIEEAVDFIVIAGYLSRWRLEELEHQPLFLPQNGATAQDWHPLGRAPVATYRGHR